MERKQATGGNFGLAAFRPHTVWTWALLASWALTAAAEEPLVPAYQSPAPMAFSGSPALVLLRTLASLALVLGLITGLAWLTKVKGGMGITTTADSRLRILESLTLGPGRTVYLVAVGSRVLLLGSDGHRLTTLSELQPDEVGFDPSAVSDLDGRSFLARFREAGGA